MSNEAGIWFPYHIKDFRSETWNMNRIEKSCYLSIWEMLWLSDGALRADDKYLASELQMTSAQWAKVKDKVLRGFVIDQGWVKHHRVTAELEKAKANIEQRRRAGRASGEARKANGRSTSAQRTFNGEATDGQPRAGGGDRLVSSSPYQEEKLVGGDARESFQVIEGGK